MSTLRKVMRTAAVVVLTLCILFSLQRLVMPKYMHGIVEGAMISEYYSETIPHNVIFVGDCEVYENFSPVTLWEEYGISSYIRGSAQQLIWQSYYLAEETLKYEKPEAFVFNVLSMEYDQPQSEAYNRMTLDGMRLSIEKLKAIKASMKKDEHLIEYLLPILRYHSRITELTEDDLDYYLDRDKVTHNGYYMRVDVKPAENIPKGRLLGDYNFGENSYYWLDRLRVLCEENGVQLILIKAPSLYPYWYEEWDEQIRDYAERYGLPYYNLLAKAEEIGLDFTKDTYDGGLHMNLSGAEKLSRYFGEILRDECHISDMTGTDGMKKAWEEKSERYREDIDSQVKRLNESNDASEG